MIRTVSIIALAMGAAVPAMANSSTPKLHPVKEACITYETSGQMMNGTSTRCHRDYGYEVYELEDMTVGFGGFTQSQKSHRVTQGDTIYALDLQANRATKTKNPMYEQMAGSLERDGPEAMAKQFMTAMGYVATGQKKTIAGQKCEVFTSQMVGSTCLTKDLLALEQVIMGNTMTATSVKYNGGDKDKYALPSDVTIQEMPDMTNGLQGLDLESLMNPK